MIKAISSIFSPATFAISSTNLCTIGFPPIGINGFGTVKVCGRNLEPRPAIGTIIFIIYQVFLVYFYSPYCVKFYFEVLPKPPSPLSVSLISVTSCQVIVSYFAIIICAIRSPFLMIKLSADKFTKITPISPR